MFTSRLTESQIETIKHMIAFARLGEPEDIAKVVLFLTNEQAGWITGQTVRVNGVTPRACKLGPRAILVTRAVYENTDYSMRVDREMRIGVIGLGAMGRPIAINLITSGHQVLVSNRSLLSTLGTRMRIIY